MCHTPYLSFLGATRATVNTLLVTQKWSIAISTIHSLLAASRLHCIDPADRSGTHPRLHIYAPALLFPPSIYIFVLLLLAILTSFILITTTLVSVDAVTEYHH